MTTRRQEVPVLSRSGHRVHRPTVAMTLGAGAGLLSCAALVWHASLGAYVARTPNPTNSVTTGTVAVTNDFGGSALFTVSGLRPGQSARRCIVVDYTGTLPADVRMRLGNRAGTLPDYLDVSVRLGTGGGPSGSCAGFSPVAENVYRGRLSAFPTSYAAGVGDFKPSGPLSRTYQVAVAVADDAAAPGTSATSVAFVWEARNT